MKKNYVLLFLLVISITAFCTPNDIKLVSINRDQKNLNKSFIEKVEISVFYYNKDFYLAGIDKNQQKVVEKKNIKFEIIDDQAFTENYYILSSKKIRISKNANLEVKSEDLIYKNGEISIIKGNRDTFEYYLRKGFSLKELRNRPLILRDEGYLIDPSKVKRSKYKNQEILDLIEELNNDSLKKHITELENFVTREASEDNRREVAVHIVNKFRSYGIEESYLDSFHIYGGWQYNVIAEVEGSANPEEIIVIGGHHDSITNNPEIAPGADDNASGVAVAMEIARVIKKKNYQPERTIYFMTYAAEEYGLLGSESYAYRAKQSGKNFMAMLNNDMVAYSEKTHNTWKIDLRPYIGSEALNNKAMLSMINYSTIEPQWTGYNSSGSDSYSFYEQGYMANFFIENHFSPHYHTNMDKVEFYIQKNHLNHLQLPILITFQSHYQHQ